MFVIRQRLSQLMLCGISVATLVLGCGSESEPRIEDADAIEALDGSGDSIEESPICDPRIVHDCECDFFDREFSQCCWRGTTYGCVGRSSGVRSLPTVYEFEYERTVQVDDCNSLPTCPLDVDE
jgi:hypothetical protein